MWTIYYMLPWRKSHSGYLTTTLLQWAEGKQYYTNTYWKSYTLKANLWTCVIATKNKVIFAEIF